MGSRNGWIKTTGLIVVSTLIISLFTFASSTLYNYAFGESTLPANALIGSVSVSGLDAEEAREKLTEAANEWKATQKLSFKYNDEEIPLNGDLWEFQIDLTVTEMMQSESDDIPLHVVIDEELLKTSLLNLDANPENYDLALLKEVLTGYASTFERNAISIELSDYYAVNQSIVQIAESRVKGTSELILVPNLAESISSVTIQPEETISVRQLLIEAGTTEKATDSLNMFSSALFELILQTNFEVIERHTSLEFPKYGEPGLNATVNMQNQDLKFHNPNSFSYEMTFAWVEDELIVTLFGPEFPLDFQPSVEKKSVEKDTIIQYSSTLSGNNKTIVEEGKEGLLVVTYRETLDKEGNLVKQEKILEDFYPPVHRIEVRAYPTSSDSTGTTGSSGNESNNEDNTENADNDGEQSGDPSQTEDGNASDNENNDGSDSETDENGWEVNEDDEIIKGLEYKQEGD